MRVHLSKFIKLNGNNYLKEEFLKKNYSQNAKKLIISSPEFHSILTEELLILKKIFKQNNFLLRIAGGAVRDLLNGMSD